MIEGVRKEAQEKGVEDVALPIIEDIERYADFEAVAKSQGGKVLISTLERDVEDAIQALCDKYKTASLPEMQAYAATLSVKRAILLMLSEAGNQKVLAREALEKVLNPEPAA